MTLDGYGQEEEILGKAYDARLMRRLGRYLKPYRWYIILAIIVLIIATLAELAGPYIT
jgi:ATP-binding cassette, subfamily B, multidrug efflux pump